MFFLHDVSVVEFKGFYQILQQKHKIQSNRSRLLLVCCVIFNDTSVGFPRTHESDVCQLRCNWLMQRFPEPIPSHPVPSRPVPSREDHRKCTGTWNTWVGGASSRCNNIFFKCGVVIHHVDWRGPGSDPPELQSQTDKLIDHWLITDWLILIEHTLSYCFLLMTYFPFNFIAFMFCSCVHLISFLSCVSSPVTEASTPSIKSPVDPNISLFCLCLTADYNKHELCFCLWHIKEFQFVTNQMCFKLFTEM